MIANLLPVLFLIAQPATGTAEPAESAPPTRLDTVQQGALRCSAAFALVAERQRQGDANALEYPAMAERGREFFVQSGARLMDDAGLSRADIQDRMRDQASTILAEGSLDDIMPPCLLLLEASGL